tara:strand:+ start:302 stop:1693 length:1392 start_codon:yes stop_codon:yes gene_type:complete
MLDRFVTGEVDRISPEAPVPVLRIVDEQEMVGGVGNVCRNLIGLGGTVDLVALTGDDKAGTLLQEMVGALEGATVNLIVESTRRTAIKTRFLAGNQQIMRADSEMVGQICSIIGGKLEAAATDELESYSALVLSDYGKGVFDSGRAQKLINAAQKASVSVIVDPVGNDYTKYSSADLVTPNRKELAEATGLEVNNIKNVEAAATTLMRQHNFGSVLVTLSQDGMLLVTDDESLHVSTHAREVFDVSGAGDTVVAVLAGALAGGAVLADAVRLANLAAGVVVGKIGTGTVYTTEIVAALHHQEISRAEAKIISMKEVRDRVEVWHRQGLKIGFTNGCFDLLHPGHVSLLAQARDVVDKLIVGLNSDESIARLKGKDRPVQNETSRAAVLASLASVDVVVLFSDDTPLDLIKYFQPDVLIKGSDYTKGEVVGAAEVEGWGGEIFLATLVEGHSTTATIRRLAERG